MKSIGEIIAHHHGPVLDLTQELQSVFQDYPGVLDLMDVITMGAKRGIDSDICRVVFENLKGN